MCEIIERGFKLRGRRAKVIATAPSTWSLVRIEEFESEHGY